MTLCENSNLHINRTSASLRVAATGSSNVGLLKRNLMDKIDRYRRRAWNDEQKDLARAAFPLPDELMEQLFSAVDQALEVDGCDHTLRFTESWLNRNGSDRQTTIAWLKEHGGYCDCEVIANACDYWEQNR
jgi:hypothetical protein